MHKRILGRTGLRLSELGLGTWGLAAESYGPIREGAFRDTVEAAIQAGVTTFDMAPIWGDGLAERQVAEVVGSRRSSMIYVTRCGARWADGELQQSYSPEAITADAQASLERLETDSIDVLLLHAPSREVLRQAAYKPALLGLQTAGKLRTWGACVRDLETGRAAIEAGAAVISLPYNLLESDLLEDLHDDLRKAGVGVLTSSPLLYGMLGGTWTERRTFSPGDHRSARWEPEAFVQRVRTVDQLRFLVRGEVSTMASAALRYVLSSSLVTTAMLGARSPRQITRAAANAGRPPYLPDEDIVRITQTLSAIGT
ncbi:MAG: aldo/keto reductase [Myxococcales bacterium]|nr:aldo/keto reductase [Myxococcales bacterium]